MLKIITIQKVFAENKQLHTYLTSKGLNQQANIFFIKQDKNSPPEVIMLSALGHLFSFQITDGKYNSVRFENEPLLMQAIQLADNAVNSNKYPFFRERLEQIKRNLNYIPKTQGLF